MTSYKTVLKHIQSLVKSEVVDSKVYSIIPQWYVESQNGQEVIHSSDGNCRRDYRHRYLSAPSGYNLLELSKRKTCACLEYHHYSSYFIDFMRRPTDPPAVSHEISKEDQKDLLVLVNLKIFEAEVNKLLEVDPNKIRPTLLRKKLQDLDSSKSILELAENVKIVKDRQRFDTLIENVNEKLTKAKRYGEKTKTDPAQQQKHLKAARAALLPEGFEGMELDESMMLVGSTGFYMTRALGAFLEAFSVVKTENKHVSLMPRYAYEYLQRVVAKTRADAHVNGILLATAAGDHDAEVLELAGKLWTPKDPKGSYRNLREALEGAKALMK